MWPGHAPPTSVEPHASSVREANVREFVDEAVRHGGSRTGQYQPRASPAAIGFGWSEANDARLATDSQAMGTAAGRIDDQPQPFGGAFAAARLSGPDVLKPSRVRRRARRGNHRLEPIQR